MAAAISRRNVLRAGVVGGALVWAVPAVQLLDSKHAFAATGSGSQPPPPAKGRTQPGRTLPTGARTNGGLPTSVKGETITKTDPGTVGSVSTVASGTLTAAGGGAGTTTSTAGAVLPFTGNNLPIKAAVEAGAGLVVGGAVLRTLAARRSQVAGGAPDEAADAPTD